MIRNKKLLDSITDYGDVVMGVNTIVDAMLTGEAIEHVFVDDESEVNQYVESCRRFDFKPHSYKVPVKYTVTPEQHLAGLSTQWTIPKEYLDLDIVDYLAAKCKSAEEKERLALELQEFHQRDQIILLYVMVYLVDIMRKNNIVWGVGRGSSVASFCLYLIGINKINPMEYGIEYTEFFKPINN